jgi:carbon-monoxide dehydrogenase small subunit
MSVHKEIDLKFILNGKETITKTRTNRRLMDLLRIDLGLTGTKEGCGIGECGGCTVLVDGKPVNSCIVLAAQIDGCEVLTIEGLAESGNLHPLQEKFLQHGAVQCGFCTPGMIMTAYALLNENPDPTPDEIREAIAGNLCRCTGYNQIVQAIHHAAGDT